MFRKNQNENTEVKKDLYLIERIQPAGGISFSDEKYVSTGTGYEACIHIFSYKKKISDHWLKSLTDIENTIVTLDVKTDNIDEVKRNLNWKWYRIRWCCRKHSKGSAKSISIPERCTSD